MYQKSVQFYLQSITFHINMHTTKQLKEGAKTRARLEKNWLRFIPVFIVIPYLKDEGSLNEGFLESPSSPYFIDASQVFLTEGRNILGIFVISECNTVLDQT